VTTAYDIDDCAVIPAEPFGVRLPVTDEQAFHFLRFNRTFTSLKPILPAPPCNGVTRTDSDANRATSQAKQGLTANTASPRQLG
jgi:hypothetical protein